MHNGRKKQTKFAFFRVAMSKNCMTGVKRKVKISSAYSTAGYRYVTKNLFFALSFYIFAVLLHVKPKKIENEKNVSFCCGSCYGAVRPLLH